MTTDYGVSDSTAGGTAYSEAQLADWGVRFVGFIIDGVILAIVSLVLQILHLGFLGSIVGLAYFMYFWVMQNGQSLGQSAMHIRVVKADGGEITWVVALLRYVGYIVSYFFLLGYLWPLWDPKRQGWMDKIAGTLVVKA